MAKNIKGINIQLGYETQGLEKALKDVNKRSRSLQGELKSVERLLEFDPSDTELLEQKQKLLGEAVENTKEKLNRLEQAQEQVNDQFRRGEISEEQYRSFQREISRTRQQLQRFEGQAKESAQSVDRLGDKIKRAGERLRGLGDRMKGIGQGMSAGVTAPIAGFVTMATEGTRELRTELAKLNTNIETAGANVKNTDRIMSDFVATTGEADSSAEALSNLLETSFRGDNLAKLSDQLLGASIKFKDTLKLEGLSDGLQETLATGKAVGPFAELIERLGINVEEFDAGLAKAAESGKEQEYILETLANKGLSDVAEKYRETNAELYESQKAHWEMQKAIADLGETLEPIVTKVVKGISGLLEWFNELDEDTKNLILTIGGIVAAIGPLLVIIGGAASIFNSLAVAAGALGVSIGALAAPIAIVVAAVAGLVAAWIAWGDDIKRVVGETVGNVVEWFGNLKDSVVNIFKNLKDGALDMWDGLFSGIKGFINKIIDAVNGMTSRLNQVSFSVPDWVPAIGGNSWGFNIKQIPKLADGGRLISEGLALVGERGPELLKLPRGAEVAPLNGNSVSNKEVVNNVVINNPVPMKAPDSVRRELLKLQYLGAF